MYLRFSLILYRRIQTQPLLDWDWAAIWVSTSANSHPWLSNLDIILRIILRWLLSSWKESLECRASKQFRVFIQICGILLFQGGWIVWSHMDVFILMCILGLIKVGIILVLFLLLVAISALIILLWSSIENRWGW